MLLLQKMRLSNFAGFVCNYQFSELYVKYFSSLAIVLCLAVLTYILGVKRVNNKMTRRFLTVALVIFVLVGAHVFYLLMIGGDFFGCGLFPWAAFPKSH